MKKIIMVLTLVSSFSLLAADGSSGCGPGWYLFKKNSLLSSALRATTNGVLFPFMTLGMTFGTSNCSRHSIVKTEQESLKFATENYYALASDVARGDGEYVKTFAATIGCTEEGTKNLSKKMKTNYSEIFNSQEANPSRVLEESYKIIFQDQSLFSSCSRA